MNTTIFPLDDSFCCRYFWLHDYLGNDERVMVLAQVTYDRAENVEKFEKRFFLVVTVFTGFGLLWYY